jgi:hypothetical protein
MKYEVIVMSQQSVIQEEISATPKVEDNTTTYEIAIIEVLNDVETPKVLNLEVGNYDYSLIQSERVVEVLLKDITNVNQVSQIEFKLSDTGIDFDDVDYFEIEATNLNFTGNAHMRMYALNKSNGTISGYMGYSEHANYSSSSRSGCASHNSNNQFIWFPSYNAIRSSGHGYYGGGVNMKIKVPIRSIRRHNTSYRGTGVISYDVSGWCTGCSTYSQRYTGQWSNYSNGQGWQEDIHGFRLWGTSGNFADGTIKVLIHLKPKEIGA